MRTLILHIGNHKTGTTTLQLSLTNSPETLAAAGLEYLAPQGETNLHHFLNFERKTGDKLPGARMTRLPELRALFQSSQAETVIASSENFAFLFDPDEIRQLHEIATEMFDRVKVVCYLRRQDAHLVSHHQEGSKPYRKADSELFGMDPVALPTYLPIHRLYLDYAERLAKWAQVFGEEALMIRVFERDALKDQDIVADFLDLIGHSDVAVAHAGTANTSTGLIRSKAGHIMGQAGMSESLRAHFHGRIPNGRKMLPSRAEAEAYYAFYRESNTALNDRFRICPHPSLFSEDFAQYPETALETWDEATANTALLETYRAVTALFEDIEPNHIRDAAIVLETVRPKLSLRLMTLASRLRKKGPLIQSKLEEYRAQIKID